MPQSVFYFSRILRKDASQVASLDPEVLTEVAIRHCGGPFGGLEAEIVSAARAHFGVAPEVVLNLDMPANATNQEVIRAMARLLPPDVLLPGGQGVWWLTKDEVADDACPAPDGGGMAVHPAD